MFLIAVFALYTDNLKLRLDKCHPLKRNHHQRRRDGLPLLKLFPVSFSSLDNLYVRICSSAKSPKWISD
jgi:hypothetical protein